MKKIAMVLMLALLLVSTVFAGGNVTQTCNVTAGVQAAWSLLKLTDMTFPTVNQGVPASIASNTNQAGSFQLNGGATTTVTIISATTSGLTNGTNTLPFTLANIFTNASLTPTAATSTDGLGTSNISATTNANGKLNIYIGGAIAPAANQAVGQYTGTITVSVDYP